MSVRCVDIDRSLCKEISYYAELYAVSESEVINAMLWDYDNEKVVRRLMRMKEVY